MPTFIIVDRNKDPLGPNEINSGTTVTASEGDVFIIDPSANGNIVFESASGDLTAFSVEFGASNSSNFNVVFGAALSPSISIADDVDLPRVSFNASDTDSASLAAGDGVTVQRYIGSTEGADNVSTGDNFTMTFPLNTNGGDDIVTIGSGANLRQVNTGQGNDRLVIGDNLTTRNVRTGDGNDTVSIGDGASVRNVDTGGGEDDITIGDNLDANIVRSGQGDDIVRIGANASANRLDGGPGTDTLNTQSPGVPQRNFETVNVVCFVRGTRISTASGDVEIQNLQEGDMVITGDHGPQPIRWIGSSTVCGQRHLAPIRIRQGALGNTRDLCVSPQHRMLLRGWHAELHFGTSEVLVPAKHLVNDTSIRRDVRDEVEYWHILFDSHEIVRAEGIQSESLHPGTMGIGGMETDVQEEIFNIFPHLRTDIDTYGAAARMSLKKKEARLMRF